MKFKTHVLGIKGRFQEFQQLSIIVSPHNRCLTRRSLLEGQKQLVENKNGIERWKKTN